MEKRKLQNKKPKGPSDKPVDWMIMLYIAADGNLANFAVESLKQINHSMATPRDPSEPNVVVAAQFAIDAPGGQQIPRYIFNDESKGSIKNSLRGYLNAPANMTEQEALISFMKWVFERHPAKKYALILWGHGPELLLQPPSGEEVTIPCQDPDDKDSLYLTPEELRIALTESLPHNKNLDLLAFDACSMSMFEVAFEVKDRVDFMVASQEEVPDPSFPYDTLVELFRKKGNDIEGLLRAGVYAYVGAYEDYVCDNTTGMKQVTLSALRLQKCDTLKEAILHLTCALLSARRKHPSLPPMLKQAREKTKDFVGGLYVDLYDFCTELQHVLTAGEAEEWKTSPERGKAWATQPAWKQDILNACKSVIDALREDNDPEQPGPDLLVLANCSADCHCHGVSLYLPYLEEVQSAEVQQPMVKGGRDTIGKGFSSVLNRAASSLLMCVRRDLIVITEGYYKDLALSAATGWYYFIAKVWSAILVKLQPDELDQNYSAQQSAVNAVRDDLDEPRCPRAVPAKNG